MIMENKNIKETILSWVNIFLGCTIMGAGFVFFINPYNIVPGGVYGLSIVCHNLIPSIQVGTFGYMFDIPLMIISVLLLGGKLGGRTIAAALTTPFIMNFLSWLIYPNEEALQSLDPTQLLGGTMDMSEHLMLTTIIGAVIIGIGQGIVVRAQATTGGTDIIAMLLKKYTSLDIGKALFCVDLIIVAGSCFVFDIQTGLFSFTGLMAKTLVIDGVIENINLCKYFTIVCEHPEPICDFIHNKLHRGATIFRAEGSYAHHEKTVVLSVMKRSQAVQLRNYIRQTEPHAFMMITNSSEIIGKGFRGLN